MSVLEEISENLQKGKAKIVKELVQNAVDSGIDPETVLREGLLPGMSVIGEKFKNNEVYVPEVLGKNLVKMMMEGKGLEVVDLGTDVAPETFIQTAIEQNCQIICCSALLTTTMGVMEEVVKKAVEAGIRDKVKIMIGGAPVDEAFCEKIGADKYTPDAASAADAAAEFCASMA